MKFFLIALTMLFSSNLLLAAQEMMTFKVKNRPSADILSDIQKFLPENTVSQAHNELIILKIESNSINEIKALIEQLDVKERSIVISVMKTSKPYSEIQKLNPIHNVTVENAVTAGINSTSKTWSTHKDNGIVFSTRGLSGHSMTIQLNKSIPHQNQVLIINQNGNIGASSNTEYLNLSNGFKANAKLLDNGYTTVNIIPMFSELTSSNSVTKISSITNISGPIGHWLQLGHIVQTENLKLLNNKNYSTHRQQSTYLYMKVDIQSSN